jgi:hypothetical protein
MDERWPLAVPCRAFAPFEANPPLLVDADALLSAPIACDFR